MAVKDIERSMSEFAKRVDQSIDIINKSNGEKFIIDAKNTNTYKDVTANLRNSIGYIIIDKGAVIAKKFEKTATGNTPSNDNPTKKGEEAAMEMSRDIDDKAVIMVAGMEYAAAVEARGYDVISNSVNVARDRHARDMEKLLKKLVK
jgi:hypothetical protein